MKKIISILTIAAVFLCSAVLTSCGAADAVKEVVGSTYDQWYMYNGSTKLSIPLGTDEESMEETDKSLNNADVYVYFNAEDGLKVAVQSVNKTDVELLGGLVKKQEEVVVGGIKTYSKDDFNAGYWTSLMLTDKFDKCDEPKISADKDNCVIIGGDDAPNFQIQWKKFLKQKIVNTLLGED